MKRKRAANKTKKNSTAAVAAEAKSGTIRITGDVHLQVGMQTPSACSIAPMSGNITGYQVSDTIDLDTLVYAINRSENAMQIQIQLRNSSGEKLVETFRDLGPWGQAIISAKALIP